MKERVCGKEMRVGINYYLMMKSGKEHTLKITDAYTLESDILTVMPVGSCDVGEHWGQRSYSVIGGVCKQLPVTSI